MGRREDREALRDRWSVFEPVHTGVPMTRKDLMDADERPVSVAPVRLAEMVDLRGTDLHGSVRTSELARALGLQWSGPNAIIGGVSSLGRQRAGTLTFATRPVMTFTASVVITDQTHTNKLQTVIHSSRPRLDFARALMALHRAARFEGAPKPRIHATATIKPGAIIGEAGFGFEVDEAGIPQRLMHLGGVVIGEGAEIGSFTTVCRGTLDDTVVEAFAKIDDHVHVAHNVHVGRGAMVIAGAVLCGSARIAAGAYVGASACIRQGLTVGAGAFVGMGAVVIRDVPPGVTVVGNPARELVR